MSLAEADHYARIDGVTAWVLDTKDEGQKIYVTGFMTDRWKFKKGQSVIFELKNGETTRYKILEARFPTDPKDQYFLECEFYPRTSKIRIARI